MWEIQLRNLGGPNYTRFTSRILDDSGVEIPNHRGYKYFGRARELPGVKELFEELKPKKPDEGEREKKRDLRKVVDADYYGFNRDEDEEEGMLKWERKREREAVEGMGLKGGEVPRGWMAVEGGWKVPTLEEVTEFLVERRKSRLLQKLG